MNLTEALRAEWTKLRTSHGTGEVRITPMTEPITSAITQASSAVASVQQAPNSSSCK